MTGSQTTWLVHLVLALLDYVSRAHEIAIRPSSITRTIISETNAQIAFKFWLLVPLSHMPGHFFEFLKKKFFLIFYECFSFSLTWDPMGAKISKRYSSYKSQPKVFKLFLNFLPNGGHKTTFGIFEILKIEILTNFIRFR